MRRLRDNEMEMRGGKHGMQAKGIQKLFDDCVAPRILRHFLAVGCIHGQIHTHVQAHIVIELACLANVQGPAMKSAWESSGGPEQDTERERDCWAQIKFQCLFARPSPSLPLSIHPFPHHQPFLFSFFRNQPNPCQSPPGQGNMSDIVKSPYDSK